MIEVIYRLKLDDEWMDPDFSKKRIEADGTVEFKIDYNEGYAIRALELIEPLIEELDEITGDDAGFKEKCQYLIEKVNRHIAKNPDVSQFYDVLSDIYFGMGDKEKCYQTLRKQIEVFPDNYMSKFMAGIKLLDLDKLDEIENLLNGALDVRDLKVGPKGLTEFEVCAFYTLQCKYFMLKEAYEKAEVYYQFVREMQLDNGVIITTLHMDVLFQYGNFKKGRLEKHLGMSFEEILEEEEVKRYLTDFMGYADD
ncbi:tetratricopeptide repeat protein [Aquiflexum sp.]|uniref:tetratricopeptide repeat protein n=1 Tax=Aquiflexum sp. TaxID=1872584 RepID=UPI0035948BBC